MGSYFNDKFFEKLDKTKTLADLLPFFVNEPLAFEPGAKWQYSNVGFTVLGLIIEKISGKNYFDYVRENIFKPAGMNNTDSYERGAKVKNLAIGYTRATLSDRGRPDPNAPLHENTQMLPLKGSSAGGGYSTLDDMLKFALALQNNKLLSKKFTEIVTTGKFDVGGPMGKYAYGFGDKIFNGKHIVGHNGGGPGIGANFDMFPELGYTAIIFSNLDSPAMFPVITKIRGLIPGGSQTVSRQTQKQQNEKPLSQAEQEVRKLEPEDYMAERPGHKACSDQRACRQQSTLRDKHCQSVSTSSRPGYSPRFRAARHLFRPVAVFLSSLAFSTIAD